MRILQIFNRYLEYGGEEACVARVAEALGSAHEVEAFRRSTQEVIGGAFGKLRMPFLMRRNGKVLDDLRRLQSERRFDFWQVDNVFPAMSVAVYELAAELGVPVVQYLHNYRFGCAGATYFTGGEMCHRCRPGAFAPALSRKCWRGSLPASAAMVAALDRFWKRGSADTIRLFIAISESQRQRHIAMGIPEERIEVIHHFLDAGPAPASVPPADGDVLFIGRITEEKGVGLLLGAWGRVESGGRRLRIVGDGAWLGEARRMVADRGLRNVVFEGFVPPDDHAAIWRDAAFSVAPSIWEEPFGMVVLEAWRQGRPVLTTDLGSFPELLSDGSGGWLGPADEEGFAVALQAALDAGGAYGEMGRAGRTRLEARFDRASWLDRIEGAYRAAGLESCCGMEGKRIAN